MQYDAGELHQHRPCTMTQLQVMHAYDGQVLMTFLSSIGLFVYGCLYAIGIFHTPSITTNFFDVTNAACLFQLAVHLVNPCTAHAALWLCMALLFVCVQETVTYNPSVTFALEGIIFGALGSLVACCLCMSWFVTPPHKEAVLND